MAQRLHYRRNGELAAAAAGSQQRSDEQECRWSGTVDNDVMREEIENEAGSSISTPAHFRASNRFWKKLLTHERVVNARRAV